MSSAAITDSTKQYEVVSLGNSGAWWKRANGQTGNAVVFVHGWGGDAIATWTRKPPWMQRLKFWKSTAANVCLMDLLAADKTINGFDIFSLGHAGGPLSKSSISVQAGALRTFVDNRLSDHDRVALVAHSLGGLVCRKMIVDWLDHDGTNAKRIMGLLTLGTPNNGTEVARLPSISRSAAQMEPLNEFLAELNRDWQRRVVNGGNPGEDLSGRAILKCRAAIGEVDQVVPPASAGTACLFGDLRVISKTGHLELCKPDNIHHPVYGLVRTFLSECETEQHDLPKIQAAELYATEARQEILNASAWCIQERDSYTIDRFSPPSDSPLVNRQDLFACDIHCTRTGVEAKKIIHVLIHIEGHVPDSLQADYSISIGKGFFIQDEFRVFSELMEYSVEQKASPLAMVDRIAISRGSRAADYRLLTEEVRCKPGWIVLPFTCDSTLADDQRHPDTKLDLRLREIVSEKQGWYRYCTSHAIVESLVVEVDSSVPIRLKDSFRGKLVSRTGGPTGSHFSAKLQITGPTPPNCWVEWNFFLKKESDNG